MSWETNRSSQKLFIFVKMAEQHGSVSIHLSGFMTITDNSISLEYMSRLLSEVWEE